jgi:hypothetical protein
MRVSWTVSRTTVRWHLHWPTSGWGAIGLNRVSALPGTHLVMAAIVQGRIILSDRHIVSVGDHREVAALGGVSHVHVVGGHTTAAGCAVEFDMTAAPTDRWHHPLGAGRRYQLLVAYAAVADFHHHSLFRWEVGIVL